MTGKSEKRKLKIAFQVEKLKLGIRIIFRGSGRARSPCLEYSTIQGWVLRASNEVCRNCEKCYISMSGGHLMLVIQSSTEKIRTQKQMWEDFTPGWILPRQLRYFLENGRFNLEVYPALDTEACGVYSRRSFAYDLRLTSKNCRKDFYRIRLLKIPPTPA